MGFVISRVYTKIGDRGTTRLAGGQEVSKTSERIEAYGTLDELNAVMGIVAETILGSEATRKSLEGVMQSVLRIQNELFDLGGELATLPEDRHERQAILSAADVDRLEREIDEETAIQPPLTSFILPGGGLVSAQMHQARTVCRRAERRLVVLHQQEPQRDVVLQYVNRLSDWMFVMGRRAALADGRGEVLWRPGARST